MRLVNQQNKISEKELKAMSEKMFGDLVKAVVDVKQKIMIVDAELHADEEQELLEKYNSQQKDLWGINIYPEEKGYFIEFDSMINLRPAAGNKSRGVDNQSLCQQIREIVQKLITK